MPDSLNPEMFNEQGENQLAGFAALAAPWIESTPDERVSDLMARLQTRADVEAVFLEHQGNADRTPRVLIRRAMSRLLGHGGFGTDVMFYKSVAELSERLPEPLTLDEHTRIEEACRAALERPLAERYDPIAVRAASGVFVLNFHELLAAQARLLQGTLAALQQQRELTAQAEAQRLQEAEQRALDARELARIDPLTGLGNRGDVTERVRDAIATQKARGGVYAVLFLDFDRFKIVNDSLGHDAGDRLLTSIAERLRRAIRGIEQTTHAVGTACRLGGDEFVIILERLHDAAEAEAFADRLCSELRRVHTVEGYEIYSTASIGLTSSELDYRAPDEVLRDADVAMYQAKERGKDCFVRFDESMRERMVDRLELEAGLQRAADAGELVIEYQPIVSADSGRVVGSESLLRWDRPGHGRIAPADFIPIAEETGLICPIGRWIMREALSELKRLQQDTLVDPSFYLSVNVSKRQLFEPGFVDQVRDAVHRAGVDPASVCLEVTESVVIHDPDEAARLLHDIKSTGVKVAMDDFGIGQSSLTYLRKFPIDVLKIDQQFVRNIQGGRGDLAIIQAVLTLAQNLGMTTVVEGVETPEQFSTLQAMDCNAAQGYLFARPMNAEALREYLRAERGGLPALAA